jgi:membrane protein insertase Oxa1/YidC/SpoIIIJ
MFFITKWYLVGIYQPVVNALVGLYALFEKTKPASVDFGLILIGLTLFFRFLWLPISIASSKTYKENRAYKKEIDKIKRYLS